MAWGGRQSVYLQVFKCQQCHKEFSHDPWASKTKKYCSEKCANRAKCQRYYLRNKSKVKQSRPYTEPKYKQILYALKSAGRATPGELMAFSNCKKRETLYVCLAKVKKLGYVIHRKDGFYYFGGLK